MFKILIILFTTFLTSSWGLSLNSIAPDFSLMGANGKNVELKQFKNKIIVLEWINHGCPFIKKHYDSGNMQMLQKKYTAKDVMWLSIISSAKGKQGHVDVTQAKTEKEEKKSFATDVLLDIDGKIGQTYGAKTTPHFFIISKEGKVVYQGAIDSEPSADPDDIKKAKNYISQALDELIDGKKISIAETKPYGCSVKY